MEATGKPESNKDRPEAPAATVHANEPIFDPRKGFPGFDRTAFPSWITNVAPTPLGSDALLITCDDNETDGGEIGGGETKGTGAEISGTESGGEHSPQAVTKPGKTLLYDCGKASQAAETIAAIDSALDGRPLDFIAVSHSHYDHIGALPFVLEAHPEAKVIGSAYTQYVFGRPGARKEIARLGAAAFGLEGEEHDRMLEQLQEANERLRVDIVVGDGDVIDLGGRQVRVIETKGHTDCSLAFAIEPERLLLASESTGESAGPGNSVTAILKSNSEAIASAKKCRAYEARQVVSPHLGLTPPSYAGRYFADFIEAAEAERSYMEELCSSGLTFDEMLCQAERDLWPAAVSTGQNWSGFTANFRAMVKVYSQ